VVFPGAGNVRSIVQQYAAGSLHLGPAHPSNRAAYSGSERRTRVRHVQDRDLGVYAAVKEREVADKQLSPLEDQTRREVHRVGPTAHVASRDSAAVGGQHLDLAAHVGTDVQVTQHVEHDAVSAPKRVDSPLLGVEGVAVGENLDRARAATAPDTDTQDAPGGCIGDVEELLVAVEPSFRSMSRMSTCGCNSAAAVVIRSLVVAVRTT
jgi:hypothetical protein